MRIHTQKPVPVPPVEEAEVADDMDAELPATEDISDLLNAEDEVADTLDDISLTDFDDAPIDRPLDFDDGTDMGHPRGGA